MSIERLRLDDFNRVPSRREPDTAANTGGLWFESAAELLAEADPGPTPFLVEDMIVEGAVAALVGQPKTGKTWTLLELALAVATGTKALGIFAVAEPGPVLVVVEESGRAALHRRLDSLARGRALSPERLRDLHFAANRRVRLDEDEWRERLLEAARAKPWRMIAFDPFVRVKGLVDENVQREVGPILDFLRELRDVSGAAVSFVQHTPHDGKRMRGSSDFEAYWESKITLTKNAEKRVLEAEHREAEGTGPFELSFAFDHLTHTLRVTADESELARKVREFLEVRPKASANDVNEAMKGTKGTSRTKVLELVKKFKEGGSTPPEPSRTTPARSTARGGSAATPYRGAGTTAGEPVAAVVRPFGNHRPGGRPFIGEEGFVAFVRAANRRGFITDDELLERLRMHGFVLRRTLPMIEDEAIAAVLELTEGHTA